MIDALGGRPEDALIAAINEFSVSVQDFRADLPNINDPILRDKATLIIDVCDAVIRVHAEGPTSTAADDFAGLLSGAMSIRSPVDQDVGPTASRAVLRKNVGLLIANLADVVSGCRRLGLAPRESAILENSVELPRANSEGKIEALRRRLQAVEEIVAQLGSVNDKPTALRQQSGLLNFYVGSMKVEIDLAWFHLRLSNTSVDLSSLTRAVEVMTELTGDFVATVEALVTRLTTELIRLVNPLVVRFRRFSRGVATVVSAFARGVGVSAQGAEAAIGDQSLNASGLDYQRRNEFEDQERGEDNGGEKLEGKREEVQKSACALLLEEKVPRLRRYAVALTGSIKHADAVVEAALTKVGATRDVEGRPIEFEILYRAIAKVLDETQPKDILEPSEQDSAAQRRLKMLPIYHRQVFLLLALEGFSEKDVALILRTSVSDIRQTQVEVGEKLADLIKTKVLIVEDDTFIGLDLSQIFSSLGHHVVGVARTASEAMKLWTENNIGLIIADIQLVNGDSGLDVVNLMLRQKSVPTVFITAYPERFLTGPRPDPAFLMAKPFSPAMVAAVTSLALFFDRSARPRPFEKRTLS